MGTVEAFRGDPSLTELFRTSVGFQRDAGLPRIPSEWMRRSNRYGFWATVRIFGALLLLLAAAPWLALSQSSVILVLLVPLIAAYIYKLTLVMHDCAHRSLFAQNRYNRSVGELCAGFLGTDFHRYAQVHLSHHRFNGMSGDREGPALPRLKDANRRQRILYLLEPLTGYSTIGVLALRAQVRRCQSALAADPPPTRSPLPLWRYGKIVGIQLGLVVVATGLGQVWWLAVLYPACAATLSLFLSRMRGFSEHVAPAGWQGPFTRTHQPNWFDRLFFYDLNFNYHIEHHMFPSLPSFRLQEVHGLLCNGYHSPATVSPSIAATVWKRLTEVG